MATFIMLATAGVTFVARPLITDDSGTQGKGRFQIEVNSEFTHDKEMKWDDDAGNWVTAKETGGEIGAVFSYSVV